MITITKKEWKVVALASVAVIVLTFLPLMFGYLHTPKGSVFLFSPNVNFYDHQVYYSQIEQVKVGNFLLKDLFASEPQPLGMFNPFWLTVGSVARVFSLPAYAAFHLARLALIPLFLAVAYCAIAYFFKEEIKRKICFIFFIFSSGCGWMLLFNSIAYRFNVLDLNVPDAFPLAAMYSSPHFIAALILFLLVFLYSAKAFEQYLLKHSFLAGFFSLLLFSFHPYHVYTIFGVLGGFILLDSIKNKRMPILHIRHVVVVLVCSLPAILYHQWTIATIPIVQEHFLQNFIVVPPAWTMLVTYVLLLPLAFLGMAFIAKKPRRSTAELLVVTWFCVQCMLLLFLLVKTQLRLVFGLHFPLAILVTYGFAHLASIAPIQKIVVHFYFSASLVQKKLWMVIFTSVFVVGFFLSHLVVLGGDALLYADASPNNPFYISHEARDAMVWLRQVPQGSSIVSSLHSGSLIPVFSLQQVFLGHAHETAQFKKKRLATELFFRESDAAGREMFLRQNDIDYLFFGPTEKNMANFDPNQEPFLQKVYENDSVVIYKVI